MISIKLITSKVNKRPNERVVHNNIQPLIFLSCDKFFLKMIVKKNEDGYSDILGVVHQGSRIKVSQDRKHLMYSDILGGGTPVPNSFQL